MKKNLWKPFIALTLAFCLFCGATGACASAIGSGATYTGETYDAYPPIGAGASYTGTRTYNAAFGLVDGTNTLNLRTGPGTSGMVYFFIASSNQSMINCGSAR